MSSLRRRSLSWESNWKVQITDTRVGIDADKKKYTVSFTFDSSQFIT